MAGAANLPDLSGFTYSGDGSTAVQPASDSTGDQGILSGLSDIFSTVGTAVATDVKATQAPPMSPITTTGGTLVYNPATGQWVSAQGLTASSSMTPLLILLGLGLLAYFLMKK